MSKENNLRHPAHDYSPLGTVEQRLVKRIMRLFGTDVQIFYQREPSRNNFQTETERAFEEFMKRRFGERLEIAYEPQEFVRVTKPNGSLMIKASVPDYIIKLRKGKEGFTEITSSSRSKINGKNKRLKHKLIMEAGFGKDVDSIVELKLPKRINPRRIKTFGFRVLLPDRKMLLVRVPMRINKSITKLKTDITAKPGRTNSGILYKENLRKIEKKHRTIIIYERPNGCNRNHCINSKKANYSTVRR
jgi:hypothetical protein